MTERGKVTLKGNNVLTNDPCAICGERCDPGGLDYFLDGTERLVCEQCASRLAPELVAARATYEAVQWKKASDAIVQGDPAGFWYGPAGAVEGEPLAQPWKPTGTKPPEHCAACGLAIEPMLPDHWEECPECGAREYIESEGQHAMPVVEDHDADAKLEELKAGLLGLNLARIEGEQAAANAELERVRGKSAKVARTLSKTKLGARFFGLLDRESDLRERAEDLSWQVRGEYARLELLAKVQAGELTLEAAGLGTDL